MKNLIIASLFFVSGLSFADGHTDSEKDVLDALSAYLMQEMIKTGRKLSNMRARVVLIIRTQMEVFTNP